MPLPLRPRLPGALRVDLSQRHPHCVLQFFCFSQSVTDLQTAKGTAGTAAACVYGPAGASLGSRLERARPAPRPAPSPRPIAPHLPRPRQTSPSEVRASAVNCGSVWVFLANRVVCAVWPVAVVGARPTPGPAPWSTPPHTARGLTLSPIWKPLNSPRENSQGPNRGECSLLRQQVLPPFR